MISKELFNQMTNDEAFGYIEKTYCIDDINDACYAFVEEYADDEEEYYEILEEWQPYQFVKDNIDESITKEFLWENVVEQCEEIDEDEED